MWEDYFRDLAVFGANSYELIPPRSDDRDDSPHFPLPKIDMMAEMSRLLDEYGLDVWIWYPAMDEDYSDPETVEFALQEWGEVFQRLPRIDHILVPGGDPGHTQPKYLMALLEKQAAQLRRLHPGAGLWVSPQGFSADWLDEFFQILETEPEWLTGLVYGPHIRISLPEMAERAPDRYPIRRYPDITHSMQSQYPVPDWDLAYHLTLGRESINPRPTQQAVIFHHYKQYTMGVLTYSEGVNDDVNKAVWSGLSWNPDEPVLEILRDYARYYVGPDYTDTFAQGLLALERNWVGPLRTNDGVTTTLQSFQQMESEASPDTLLNWRFQSALYRAYYDAFVRSRLIYETGLEEKAMAQLRTADRVGSREAMKRATDTLSQTLREPVSLDWRTRLFQLAEALFQSIRMQLSVEAYQATQTIRGANLDNVDVPLNNRLWLEEQFDEIRALDSEDERLKRLAALVDWTNPGPGGFYDDLGSLTGSPHLVRGPGFHKDPDFLRSALVGAMDPAMPYRFYVGFPEEARDLHLRTSWKSHAISLNDQPLTLRYEGLDPGAAYAVRVTYVARYPPEGTPGAEFWAPPVRLVADGEHEVHPLRDRTFPIQPHEFDVPRAATEDGVLELACQPKIGVGGFERGCRISEVWLIRK